MFQQVGTASLTRPRPGAFPTGQAHPNHARFARRDAAKYEEGMKLYAYVGGDPVNLTDPTGTSRTGSCDDPATPALEVCGSRERQPIWNMSILDALRRLSDASQPGVGEIAREEAEIVVTGQRPATPEEEREQGSECSLNSQFASLLSNQRVRSAFDEAARRARNWGQGTANRRFVEHGFRIRVNRLTGGVSVGDIVNDGAGLRVTLPPRGPVFFLFDDYAAYVHRFDAIPPRDISRVDRLGYAGIIVLRDGKFYCHEL